MKYNYFGYLTYQMLAYDNHVISIVLVKKSIFISFYYSIFNNAKMKYAFSQCLK